MDPTKNLEEQMDLANEIIEAYAILPNPDGTASDLEDLANELAQKVCDLHDWLSNGGHLPEQWKWKQRVP